jgi:hypothetical protein
MQIRKIAGAWMWLILIGFVLSSCAPKSTPPGATLVGGGVEDTMFSYHRWEEGLAILIWHDIAYGGSGCNGSASTEDPVYRLTCDAVAPDGRTFDWEVHSTDGVTAQMWINGQSYDLDQGTVFLISEQDGQLQVTQIQRDLSGLEPDYESVTAYASIDGDITAFIENVSAR